MFINTLKAIDTAQLRLKDHEAADILHNVTQAYDALFKRFEQTYAVNKPLYVIMGEYHDRPSHRIAHTLLTRCLSDLASPIITALECPINIKASDYPGLKLTASTKRALCPESVSNLDLLKNYMMSEHAPYSGQSFKASLIHQRDRLITIFNDIARNDDYTMDLSSMLGPNEADLARGITSKSVNGVALRNIHMSDHLIAAVKEYKAPLAIQICGQAHVNGSEFNSPKESLTGLLKAKKQEVFNIFWGAASAMPIHLAPSEFYISKNMPDRYINYQQHGSIDDYSPEELENYNLEKDYVQRVYQSLGIKPPQ
jgi:hypothetical protein